MRLTYHPEADAELTQTSRYYEDRSPGLGRRFLQAFDEAVADILASPKLWPVMDRDVHYHSLRSSPFGVLYRFSNDEVRIFSIKHHSRHPNYWRHRLDG